MKKILTSMMVFAFLFILVGCVNLDSIKSDFEEAGYTYSEDGSSWISSLLTGFEEEGISIQVHVFTRGLNTAIVLEFDAEKEMKEQLEDNDTLKGLIADLDDADLVRGNFLLIPISLTSDGKTQMIEIFNGDYNPELYAKS
ncbi:MAG: hypothetical protein CVV56_01010 [Tenericutes bacterium HGW-Tenericutes-1]|jgi:hypothetical protein|nr:MAG: hypothetical protein CVV56_01010 [Tenericutes bacterium HGW-Tenericutes-1]